MSVWVRKRLQGPGVGAETSDRERPAEGRSDRSLVYGDNGIWVERRPGVRAQGGSGRWLTQAVCAVGWLHWAAPSPSLRLERMQVSTPSLELCWPVSLSPQSARPTRGRSLSTGRFPEPGWNPGSVTHRLRPPAPALPFQVSVLLGPHLLFLGSSSLLGSLLRGPQLLQARSTL